MERATGTAGDTERQREDDPMVQIEVRSGVTSSERHLGDQKKQNSDGSKSIDKHTQHSKADRTQRIDKDGGGTSQKSMRKVTERHRHSTGDQRKEAEKLRWKSYGDGRCQVSLLGEKIILQKVLFKQHKMMEFAKLNSF